MAALSALLVLVVFDGAFSGFRAVAGTSGRIDKRVDYARAMGAGAVMGACIAAMVGAGAIILAAGTPSTPAFWQDANLVAERMVCFFAPMAVLVSALLAVRAVRSVDVRSVASTLMFGAGDAPSARDFVAGTVWAVLGGADHGGVAVLCAAGAAAMLAVTPCVR